MGVHGALSAGVIPVPSELMVKLRLAAGIARNNEFAAVRRK